MSNLVRILVSNEYHYLHTFYYNKGCTIPIKCVSYIRFIACIIPAYLKILFYLKRNIDTKFLIFTDKGCKAFVNYKSLLYSRVIMPNACFNEAILRYSTLKAIKVFIVLSETLSAAFLKAALKRRIKVIYITNSFKPLLYKPFLFLRCNVASYRMQFHFIRQVYLLRKFASFTQEFFSVRNAKYFLFSMSANSIFVVSLLFKEFLYYNRTYITYAITKLFSGSIVLNCFSLRLALCNVLRKFYRIYNELIIIRFCKKLVFPLFQVRFYCHNGMYVAFCLYRFGDVVLIDKFLMHFIAYKNLINPKFLDLPFVFDTCKPIAYYLSTIRFLRVYFLR
ncbi:hypothetical protein JS520_00490 [Candidatus Vidania fulgoroideae]|nr:hypothetical protein JS520_00490 [Candidatus Vidania fulgoroideae]